MTPQQQIADQLAVHAAALRALARELVGAGDAADLVQETALRALRSPPREPAGLGGWLATVLRNLAGNHRRDRLRRARHEFVLATSASGADVGSDELAARRETLRAVSEAVFGLAEPYQSALVWRYFENLSPSRIAARTGVPVATIKSRLQRGLAMLRAELDRRDRTASWRGSLLAAAGLARPGSDSAIAFAAAIMTPTTKISIVAAAVVVAACLVLPWTREALPQTSGGTDVPPGATAGLASGGGGSSPAGDREAVAAAAAPDDDVIDLRHPFEFRLRCRVVDQDGLPVAGAVVAFGPAGCALNGWPELTARDGTVELVWRAKVSAMGVAVGVRVGERTPMLRWLAVEAGAVRECALLATDDLSGRCAADGPLGEVRCGMCHVSAVFPHLFEVEVQPRPKLHPESELADVLIGRPPPAAADEPPGPEDEGTYVASEVSTGETPDTRGVLSGLVVGDDDRPLVGQTVVWCPSGDTPRGRTTTDAGGRFQFTEVFVGGIEVRAGGGSAGTARVTVQAVAEREVECRIRLDRGNVLRGTAIGADGKVLEGWRVEFAASDGRPLDAGVVRKDGTFALANVPAVPGTAMLWSGDGHRLPVAVEPVALAGIGEVTFDFRQRPFPAGRLRAAPTSTPIPSPTSSPVAGDLSMRAFAWQLDTGRGAAMPRSRDGGFEIGGLRPGLYRLAFGSPATGWITIDSPWVDGSAEIDLGAIRLPRPVMLRLNGRPAAGLEFYLRRPDLDLRAGFVPEGEVVAMPPGAWLALWRQGETVRSRAFSLGFEPEAVLDFASAGR